MSYFGVIKGLFNGIARQISSNSTNNLRVELGGAGLSAFGDPISVGNTPIIQLSWVMGINIQIGSTTTANGGTADTDASRLRLQTGTNTAGSAIFVSKRPATYRPGQGIVARFTPIFTTGVANSTQIYGAGTATNGYFLGYNGTALGILHRNNGSDTWIPQASFNNDTINGSGVSGFNWSPTFGNVWMIKYPYLGYGNITFWVQNQADSGWILVHTIKYTNTTDTVQIVDPNLYFYGQVINSGNNTNITSYCGSVGFFLSGDRKFLGPQWSAKNNKAVTTANALNILTIKNATTYNGKTNNSIIRLDNINCAFGNFGNNAFGYITAVKNATLGGTPAFTPINGSTADNGATITSGNSLASFDIAGTTVTGGLGVWNANGPLNSLSWSDVTTKEILIFPGETLTFKGEVTANGGESVAVNWTEDIY